MSADLISAINTVWDASSLNSLFEVDWDSGVGNYPILHDQQAGEGQPFPYCVFEQSPGTTIDRMSGHDKDERHETRDVPLEFRVHAKQVTGSILTAKETAANLIDQITRVFGGHPTVQPQDLVLSNGFVLVGQYQTDYGIRTGDKEYEWIVSYIFRIDVPVAS